MSYILKHDEALSLAVDGIDFVISDVEQKQVDYHMNNCKESCKETFQAVKEDSDALSAWDWDTTQNPDAYDDDEWGISETNDNGGLEDDSYDLDDPNEQDEDDAKSEPAPSDPSADSDGVESSLADDADEDDDDELSVEDLLKMASSAVEDEDDESDSDFETTPGQAEGGGGSNEEPDADADKDLVADKLDEEIDIDEEIEAEAKAAADGMSDEELAEQDQFGTDELNACVSDGVDDAAEQSGVHVYDQDRKDAERSIRAQDGVSDTAYGRVAVARSTRGVLRNGRNGAPKRSGAAAAAIRNAVLRSRGGHAAITRHQSRGRLDNRSLIRIAENDSRLFKRTSAPSPTPLLVWVLVDVSGSMGGMPILDAAAVARAMAEASVGTPSMRLAIWAWSDPFTKEAQRYASAVAGVCKIWETGMPTTEVDKITQLRMGGTPDAAIMDWAWRELRRQAHGEEQPVAIMCSDGWGYGGSLKLGVDTARKHGVEVRSVAIGRISPEQQLRVYGRGNFIPWQGDIISTARPLATMLTSLAAAK